MTTPISPARGRPWARAILVAAVWATGIPGAFRDCPIAARLHRPCPGCGLTRAGLALLHGDVAASLRLHALFVPVVGTALFAVAATLVATVQDGVPWFFYRRRYGRIALVAFVVVQGATVALWIARELGLFGGPVPV